MDSGRCFPSRRGIPGPGRADRETEKSIVNILKKLRDDGKTVVVVHHDLQTVKNYFDYVTFINVSVIASGHVDETFTQENIEKTYKSKFLSEKEA